MTSIDNDPLRPGEAADLQVAAEKAAAEAAEKAAAEAAEAQAAIIQKTIDKARNTPTTDPTGASDTFISANDLAFLKSK